MTVEMTLKVLHLVSFAAGVLLSEGVSMFVHVLARRKLKNIAEIAQAALPLDRIGAGAWLVCAGSGVLLADRLGYDFTSAWIALSILLFLVLAANGIFGHSRWLLSVTKTPCEEELPFDFLRRKVALDLFSLLLISTLLVLMTIRPE